MFADYNYNPAEGISYPLNFQPPGEDDFLLKKREPVNPIYPEALVNLCKRTQSDLGRLKTELIQFDPCYAYDMKHWHKVHRKHESYFSDNIPTDRQPKWQSANGLFADGRDMDLKGWKQNQHHDELEDYNDGPKEYRICYLCTTLDEHRQHLARRGPQLKPKVKRKPQIKYIPPPPIVKKKQEEIKEKQEVLYKIIVKTGNRPQAGTSANVSFRLKGRKGWMTKKVIRKKLAVNFSFGCGTTETFYIKGPNIGELLWLVIEHDGIEKKHGWFLEDVHIVNMNTSEIYMFICKQWLSLYHGDYTIKKQLRAEPCDQPEMEYEIHVFTAKERLAGTDANVFITFYGKKGVSPKFQLQNKSRNPFERGKEDVFKINTKYVGDLSNIRLEHDNTGMAPGWLLEKVMIQELDDPGKGYTFPCGQWFARNEGDGLICRTLYPIKGKRQTDGKRKDNDDDEYNQIFYEIDIATGNKKYAGTDATVFIKIFGTTGVSKELEFRDENGHRFEKGSIDHFRVRGDDVGNIKKIQLRHDNKGIAAGWFCKQVVIKRFFSKEEVMERLSLMEDELDKNVSRRMSKLTGDDVEISPKHRQSVTFKESRPAFTGKDDDYAARSHQHRSYSSDGHGSQLFSSDENSDEDRGKRRRPKKKITYKGISHYVTDDDDDSDGNKTHDDSDDDSSQDVLNYGRDKYNRRKSERRQTISSDNSSDDKQSHTRYRKDREPLCDEYLFICQQWLAEDEADGQITRLLKPTSVTTFYKMDT